MQNTSCETLGWKKHKLELRLPGDNINNLRYADDTTLMAESEEELKRFFMKLKEESEKVGLKLNIQKMKIMASGSITSWEIDGETVADFILGGSKTTPLFLPGESQGQGSLMGCCLRGHTESDTTEVI